MWAGSLSGVTVTAPRPVKPFKTIDEQIDLLRSRGLDLNDAEARQWLGSVGYYRLSGYWYPYREVDSTNGQRMDQFVPEAKMEDVVRLYEFDRKLRTLIHDGVERIEVALRSRVANAIGRDGSLSYQDSSGFRPTFDHQGWLKTARRRVERAGKHNAAINHYNERYDGQLPIWVLMEVLDFSDVSKLYDGLPAKAQWDVAEQFGVSIDLGRLSGNQRQKAKRSHPLARWFEHLTVLRNTCAHHARVWNRSFVPAGTTALRTIDSLRSLPEGQSERIYGAMLVMACLLQTTSPGTTWALKVRSLVDDSFDGISGRSTDEMGFFEHWQDEQLWLAPNIV